MSVIWEIACESIDFRRFVQAASEYEAVTELVARGFCRILKDDVAYQEEPLFLTDAKGRDWDAMPADFPFVQSLQKPLMPALSKIEAMGARRLEKEGTDAARKDAP